MYFDATLEKPVDRVEPFSLAALAISKGKTALISEVTPQLFEEGQEVKLRKVYPHLYEGLLKKPSYKKYSSAFTVVGASWSIEKQCWYYMIRYKHQIFLWVTDDQIKKASLQTHLAEASEERYRYHPKSKRTTCWNSDQQPLDASLGNVDRWKAGSADVDLKARLAKRK